MEYAVSVKCEGPVTLEMIHPEYQLVAPDAVLETDDHLTPIYPATEGVHQLTLRALSAQALAHLERGHLVDWLPADLSAVSK